MAQGGIAAAVGADDDPALHAADTLAVGRGIADPAAVSAGARRVQRVADLERLGVQWDRDDAGRPQLAREGGHSRRRILHAGGAATGAAIARTLIAPRHWPIRESRSSTTPRRSASWATATAARAPGCSATTSSSRSARG